MDAPRSNFYRGHPLAPRGAVDLFAVLDQAVPTPEDGGAVALGFALAA